MKIKCMSKIICTVIACCLLFSMSAFAATTEFTLTITKSGVGNDTKSKRTIKSTDSAKTYYMTPTGYTPLYGGMHVRSKQLDGSAVSDTMYIQGFEGSRSGYYKNSYAPGGVYYYLEATKAAFLQGYSSQNMTGRYTP